MRNEDVGWPVGRELPGEKMAVSVL